MARFWRELHPPGKLVHSARLWVAAVPVPTGEVMGCYVPQAVVKDGSVLDVDLVLSEVATDGELLFVEYGPGPVAYTTR